MSHQNDSARPRARILGPGLAITLEDPTSQSRMRVRVRSRTGRTVELEPIPGTGLVPSWRPGSKVQLRVARPFGLFRYGATVERSDGSGIGHLSLDPRRPRRQQLRDFFRMPVRLAVRLETAADPPTPILLRGINLSAGGILVLDPRGSLSVSDRVPIGLPVGAGGEILRLLARVVRVQEDPRRAALAFESVPDGARQVLLGHLFREHRNRKRRSARSSPRLGRITALHKRP